MNFVLCQRLSDDSRDYLVKTDVLMLYSMILQIKESVLSFEYSYAISIMLLFISEY